MKIGGNSNSKEYNDKLRCPKCNTDNPEYANYCKKCGYKFKNNNLNWLFLIPVIFLVSMGIGMLMNSFMQLPISADSNQPLEKLTSTRVRGIIAIFLRIAENPLSLVYIIPTLIWGSGVITYSKECNNVKSIALLLSAIIGYIVGYNK